MSSNEKLKVATHVLTKLKDNLECFNLCRCFNVNSCEIGYCLSFSFGF